MTPAQRRLKWKWIAVAAALSLVVAFDGFMEENAAWLRWLAFFGMVLGMLGENRSRAELERDGRNRIAAAVESAPWLKAWMALCSLACVVLAIVATRRGLDLLELVGFKYFVLAFVVLVGPLMATIERQRYLDLAEDGRNT